MVYKSRITVNVQRSCNRLCISMELVWLLPCFDFRESNNASRHCFHYKFRSSGDASATTSWITCVCLDIILGTLGEVVCFEKLRHQPRIAHKGINTWVNKYVVWLILISHLLKNNSYKMNKSFGLLIFQMASRDAMIITLIILNKKIRIFKSYSYTVINNYVIILHTTSYRLSCNTFFTDNVNSIVQGGPLPFSCRNLSESRDHVRFYRLELKLNTAMKLQISCYYTAKA